jgi:hypothetical protein
MRKLIIGTTLIALVSVLGSSAVAQTKAAHKKPKTQTVTVNYVAPGGVGTGTELTNNGATFSNGSDTNYGGSNLTPPGGMKYASITITDQSGQPISASVGQSSGSAQINTLDWTENFCGKTPKPVKIDPAYTLTVILYDGTCDGSTSPSIVTTGTITAKFSTSSK